MHSCSVLVFPFCGSSLTWVLLNEGDRIRKELCQHASSRLKDEEEVKEEKGKKVEKKRRRRKMRGRSEMERSNFSDRTNYRNIREPVSAESISRRFPISSPLFPSLTVSFALRLSSLVFFFFFPFYLTIPVGLVLVRYFLQ